MPNEENQFKLTKGKVQNFKLWRITRPGLNIWKKRSGGLEVERFLHKLHDSTWVGSNPARRQKDLFVFYTICGAKSSNNSPWRLEVELLDLNPLNLWLFNLDIRALVLDLRLNLDSGPQFAEIWFKSPTADLNFFELGQHLQIKLQ